jgi:hypothetical protein
LAQRFDRRADAWAVSSLSVTRTGARTLPKSGFGSNGTGMAHMLPSLSSVVV